MATDIGYKYNRELKYICDGKYAEVRSHLSPGMRVLELGCANGYFTEFLKKENIDVVGLEVDEKYAKAAMARGLTILNLDLNAARFADEIDGEFDVIIAMDVLEHLTNPHDVLLQLKSKLTKGGKILITGPNVAYWAVRTHLLFGKWDYDKTGIMDETHLRWYTKETWRSLLIEAGFKVNELKPAEIGMFPFQNQIFARLIGSKITSSIATFLTNNFPTLFAIVFFIDCELDR